MSKNFLGKLFGVLIIALAATLWLLSEVNSDTFGFFNLSWAVVVLAGGFAVLNLLQGIFVQNPVPVKKMKIVIAVVLAIITFGCLITALAIPENIVLPIIALIVVAGLLISLVATGGKKWDTADNQKVGYKNYFERKKAEEKAEKK